MSTAGGSLGWPAMNSSSSTSTLAPVAMPDDELGRDAVAHGSDRAGRDAPRHDDLGARSRRAGRRGRPAAAAGWSARTSRRPAGSRSRRTGTRCSWARVRRPRRRRRHRARATRSRTARRAPRTRRTSSRARRQDRSSRPCPASDGRCRAGSAPTVPRGSRATERTPGRVRALAWSHHQPRDPLAVRAGVAVLVLQPLGALVEEVRLVLPGVADAAVVLDHRARSRRGAASPAFALATATASGASSAARRRRRARRRARRARPSSRRRAGRPACA